MVTTKYKKNKNKLDNNISVHIFNKVKTTNSQNFLFDIINKLYWVVFGCFDKPFALATEAFLNKPRGNLFRVFPDYSSHVVFDGT